MASPHPYLTENTLHIKPLTAHLTYHTNMLATTLDQEGRSVRVLSHAVLAAGAVGCIALTSIESISGIFIGEMGLLCNYLFFGNRIESLERWSFQLIAFGIHSLASAVLSLYLALSHTRLKHHTWNTVADKTVHLASACLAQIVRTIIFAVATNRANPNLLNRRISDLIESAPFESWLKEITSAAAVDSQHANFRPIRRMQPANLSILRLQHTGRALYLRIGTLRVNFSSLQPQQIREGLTRFIAARALAFSANVQAPLQHSYDDTYKAHVKMVIEKALLEIINSDELCLPLADNNPPTILSGLENIHSMIPWENCFRYVQYKELCAPIQCSDEKRKERLDLLKAALDNLNNSEKNLLIKHIFSGKETLSATLTSLYCTIGDLAVELHRGEENSKELFEISKEVWKNCDGALKKRIAHFNPLPSLCGRISGWVKALFHLS